MFALYRYHAVFTDSPLPLVQADKTVGRTHDPQSLGRPIEGTPSRKQNVTSAAAHTVSAARLTTTLRRAGGAVTGRCANVTTVTTHPPISCRCSSPPTRSAQLMPHWLQTVSRVLRGERPAGLADRDRGPTAARPRRAGRRGRRGDRGRRRPAGPGLPADQRLDPGRDGGSGSTLRPSLPLPPLPAARPRRPPRPHQRPRRAGSGFR